MFRANIRCIIESANGEHTIYGAPKPRFKKSERCAVVRMNMQQEPTSVRADSSASRGQAEQRISDAEFLLTINTVAEIDDLFSIGDFKFLIIAKEPRFNVFGRLDHYQIQCAVWGGK